MHTCGDQPSYCPRLAQYEDNTVEMSPCLECELEAARDDYIDDGTYDAAGPYVEVDENGYELFMARSQSGEGCLLGKVMEPGDAVKHYVKHYGKTNPQYLTALYHEYAEYHRQNR